MSKWYRIIFPILTDSGTLNTYIYISWPEAFKTGSHIRYVEVSRIDSPDVTEVRCWIYCLALFLRVFNYSWENEPPAAPVVRVWVETEGWQEEGGTLLRFLLQSLEKVKGKFSSVQLQCRLENRRSLCDVRQNQQQVFLTGQIRGSTVMVCCGAFLAECSFLEQFAVW